MKSHKGRYKLHFELAGALLAFGAGLLGVGLDRLGIPFQTYLPVIVGLLITAAASLLKVELMERIDRDSRIQSLLNQLEHKDLHKRGMEIVEQCEDALEDLSRGIIRAGSAEIFNILSGLADHAQHHIQAIHLAPDLSYIYNWKDNQGLINYYQANLRALGKGVSIERLFILRKEDVIDKSTGQVISPRVLEIMKEHQKQGIKVSITWLESVANPEAIEDFMVFDDTVALIYTTTEGKGKYQRMMVFYGSVSVRTYKQRFTDLKTLGQSLDDLLTIVGQGPSTQSPGS